MARTDDQLDQLVIYLFGKRKITSPGNQNKERKIEAAVITTVQKTMTRPILIYEQCLQCWHGAHCS